MWTFRVMERQQSSARTSLGPSHSQRLICCSRRLYIPAAVAADKTTFAVLTFILLGVSFHATPDHVFGPTEKASFMAYK